MRPLSPQLLLQLEQLSRFANEPTNFLRPGRGLLPEKDPRYFFDTPFGYRVVFSLAVGPGGAVSRELILEVLAPGTPELMVGLTLAAVLGFTGWRGDAAPADWSVRFDGPDAGHPGSPRRLLVSQRMHAFACPACERVSFNLNDVRNEYCGACHRFSPAPLSA